MVLRFAYTVPPVSYHLKLEARENTEFPSNFRITHPDAPRRLRTWIPKVPIRVKTAAPCRWCRRVVMTKSGIASLSCLEIGISR